MSFFSFFNFYFHRRQNDEKRDERCCRRGR
jgi:hypothetical protein